MYIVIADSDLEGTPILNMEMWVIVYHIQSTQKSSEFNKRDIQSYH